MEQRIRYSTKQKNCILNFFKTHKNECFSAKYIIKKENFDIGEATVYRLLAKLAQEGALKRFIADKGGGATYQYNDVQKCARHFHLKCLSCGETICMDCSFMTGMEEHVGAQHGFFVDNTKTIIYGVCKGCQ